MATVRVEAWNVLIATFVFTVGVASAGHAQADHEARGFVDRIASSIFTAAWPTATYEETSIRSISPVTGGYNVSVRFAGQSMWGGPLRLDMILMLRGGRLYDLRVTLRELGPQHADGYASRRWDGWIDAREALLEHPAPRGTR